MNELSARNGVSGTRSSAPSVFDGSFNGTPRSEMYRAQVEPDAYPDEKPMRVEQWSQQDREMYAGGIYTPGYKAQTPPDAVCGGEYVSGLQK